MIQRVNGSLAVLRALGDFDYKCVHGKDPTEQLVSPEPEVHDIERSEEDAISLSFLHVMVSGMLWESKSSVTL